MVLKMNDPDDRRLIIIISFIIAIRIIQIIARSQ
jgi:hypothetical protein